MSETCAVCGERIGYGGCFYNQRGYLNPADAETDKDAAKHYRLGYEREKARADAAEAERDTQLARRNLAQKDRNAYEIQNEGLRTALAAARRECEGLRKALEKYGAHDMDECDSGDPCTCGLDAALGPLGVGEEKSSG